MGNLFSTLIGDVERIGDPRHNVKKAPSNVQKVEIVTCVNEFFKNHGILEF